MSRTNIVLDDTLMDKARKLTGKRTKRDVVDFALRELVRKESQKSILALESKVKWHGDLDALRRNRFER